MLKVDSARTLRRLGTEKTRLLRQLQELPKRGGLALHCLVQDAPYDGLPGGDRLPILCHLLAVEEFADDDALRLLWPSLRVSRSTLGKLRMLRWLLVADRVRSAVLRCWRNCWPRGLTGHRLPRVGSLVHAYQTGMGRSLTTMPRQIR